MVSRDEKEKIKFTGQNDIYQDLIDFDKVDIVVVNETPSPLSWELTSDIQS